jgi:hypothetical protein
MVRLTDASFCLHLHSSFISRFQMFDEPYCVCWTEMCALQDSFVAVFYYVYAADLDIFASLDLPLIENLD